MLKDAAGHIKQKKNLESENVYYSAKLNFKSTNTDLTAKNKY